MNSSIKLVILFLLALAGFSCKKPYEPPEVSANNNFLVVNGVINGSAGGETIISLSRSRSLVDTVVFIPEKGAQVFIESNQNEQYTVLEKADGDYKTSPLSLLPSKQYRLRIKTADGKEYVSEFVDMLQTPAIDSVNWKQDEDVTIFVNTHDGQNKTRYYRWDFIETWEYHTVFDSILKFENGEVKFRDPSEYTFACYDSAAANNILVNSTVKLTEDVVSGFPIAIIPRNSPKISVKYSILVKQFALTPKAFEYWDILKKNSEDLGGLFDAQPAQLFGNIHNTSNLKEPVIGYITASEIKEHRIFIRESEVQKEASQPECNEFAVSPGEAAQYLKDPAFAPAYNITGGGLVIAKVACVDCRLGGGTTKKPGFWQ